MHRERLKMLEDLMRKVQAAPMPAVGFNMDYWKAGGPDSEEPAVGLDAFGRTDCGTAACAVGHACMQTSFQTLGLSYTADGHGSSPQYFHMGEYHLGMRAVQRFFDITPALCDHLFGGIDYYREAGVGLGSFRRDPSPVMPIEVADRIRQILEEAE